jgi:hypothetical protein
MEEGGYKIEVGVEGATESISNDFLTDEVFQVRGRVSRERGDIAMSVDRFLVDVKYDIIVHSEGYDKI